MRERSAVTPANRIAERTVRAPAPSSPPMGGAAPLRGRAATGLGGWGRPPVCEGARGGGGGERAAPQARKRERRRQPRGGENKSLFPPPGLNREGGSGAGQQPAPPRGKLRRSPGALGRVVPRGVVLPPGLRGAPALETALRAPVGAVRQNTTGSGSAWDGFEGAGTRRPKTPALPLRPPSLRLPPLKNKMELAVG